MIVFVENAYALVILKLDKKLRESTFFFVVYESLRSMGASKILPSGRVWYASADSIRYLKAVLGALQLPIVQPDPLGIAFALNHWKMLISDGLLTEMLIEKGVAKPRAFYSVHGTADSSVHTSKTPLIIGSNWLEHGSMTEQQYVEHLRFIHERYPRAIYVRHPREISQVPESVFGAERIVKPDLPIDLYCLNEGIPEQIIGVCSTCMLVLPMMALGRIDVDLIVLDRKHLSGPKAGILQKVHVKGRPPETIHVEDMQRFLIRRLDGVARTIKIVQQPLSSLAST